MIVPLIRSVLCLLILLVAMQEALAKDYIRLKDGRLIECAILRQDTVAVFTTDWESRHERSPSLQVFTRDEITSITFDERPDRLIQVEPYRPRVPSIELGGSLAFQTWANTVDHRKYLTQLTIRAGTALVRQFGLETEIDFTIPSGGKQDSVWSNYKFGQQFLINAVVHPVVWHNMVPFAILGGGFGRDIPTGERILILRNGTPASALDFGAGLKWGRGNLGFRLEWRTYLYYWTLSDPPVNTTSKIEGDAHQLKFGIFSYF